LAILSKLGQGPGKKKTLATLVLPHVDDTKRLARRVTVGTLTINSINTRLEEVNFAKKPKPAFGSIAPAKENKSIR